MRNMSSPWICGRCGELNYELAKYCEKCLLTKKEFDLLMMNKFQEGHNKGYEVGYTEAMKEKKEEEI